MPHWLLKSAVQRTISLLPCRHWCNEFLQTWVSKSINLGTQQFEQRVEYCRRNLEHFLGVRPQGAQNFSVLELGTGWHPVVPVGLFLCGASRIWTIDIAPHLKSARVERTLRLFADYAERGTLQRLLPGTRPERVTKLKKALEGASRKNLEAMLEELNTSILVRDAQKTGLPPGSVDLFVSISVLEYIPRPVLANMLAEFERIARPHAVLSHFINLSDQYAQFDHSITQFNFLQYSDRQWAWLDSPLTRKNRLRISDYRELFVQAGCRIIREENRNGAVSDLERIRLAPRFQRYSQADLLVLRSWLAAQFES
jgi:hypothetical protein